MGDTKCMHGFWLNGRHCHDCEQRAEGAAEERARIVAWLRACPYKAASPYALAEMLERGEHTEGGGERG